MDVVGQNSLNFSIGKIEDCTDNKCFTEKEMHQHQHYIFYLIASGSGKHDIDLNEYNIIENQALFISPGQLHQCFSENVSGYFIRFDLDFYHSIRTQYKLYDFPFFHTMLSEPCLDLGDDFSKIENIVSGMFQEFISKENFGKEAVLRYQLEIVLIELTRIKKRQKASKSGILVPNNEKLRKLEFLIEKNFIEHKEVNFYAEQLHISSRHLNNIIAAQTGKSISEMIQNRILIESKRLLSYSEKTVAEIAYELGYSDKAYFHRFFKKQLGITPSAFRNEFLKVHH